MRNKTCKCHISIEKLNCVGVTWIKTLDQTKNNLQIQNMFQHYFQPLDST